MSTAATSTATPGLGEEAVPPGEARAIAEVLDVVFALTDTTGRPVLRSQHGKSSGCVRAEFHVEPDLPAQLRHGVFREPRVFPALIRFSTATEPDESKRGGHGMAIKLFDVPREKILPDQRDATTQDFVLLDYPTFFIRNAIDYATFAPVLRDTAALAQGGWVAKLPGPLQKLAQFAYLFWRYLRTHPHEGKIIAAMRRPSPRSPLDIEYWSTTPVKLGPNAVQWSVRPREPSVPLEATPFADPTLGEPQNKLRAGLVRHLSQRAAVFDFYAQLQTDPAAMPIEDATVKWDETASPPVRVASVHIPAQEFDTARHRALGEGLSFVNWHALPDHRPLGGINRARRAVYLASADLRRRLNGVAQREPDVHWLELEWDTRNVESPLYNPAQPLTTGR
jgi:hypothetical protein